MKYLIVLAVTMCLVRAEYKFGICPWRDPNQLVQIINDNNDWEQGAKLDFSKIEGHTWYEVGTSELSQLELLDDCVKLRFAFDHYNGTTAATSARYIESHRTADSSGFTDEKAYQLTQTSNGGGKLELLEGSNATVFEEYQFTMFDIFLVHYDKYFVAWMCEDFQNGGLQIPFIHQRLWRVFSKTLTLDDSDYNKINDIIELQFQPREGAKAFIKRKDNKCPDKTVTTENYSTASTTFWNEIFTRDFSKFDMTLADSKFVKANWDTNDNIFVFSGVNGIPLESPASKLLDKIQGYDLVDPRYIYVKWTNNRLCDDTVSDCTDEEKVTFSDDYMMLDTQYLDATQFTLAQKYNEWSSSVDTTTASATVKCCIDSGTNSVSSLWSNGWQDSRIAHFSYRYKKSADFTSVKELVRIDTFVNTRLMDNNKNEYMTSFEAVVQNDTETLNFKYGSDISAKIEWYPLNSTWGDRYFKHTHPAFFIYMDQPSLDLRTIRNQIYNLKQSYDPTYFDDSAKYMKMSSLALCLIIYIQAVF